jgi:hypothetical protein
MLFNGEVVGEQNHFLHNLPHVKIGAENCIQRRLIGSRRVDELEGWRNFFVRVIGFFSIGMRRVGMCMLPTVVWRSSSIGMHKDDDAYQNGYA